MTCLSRLDRTVSFFSLKCTIHDTLRVHLSLKFYVHMSNPSSFFIFRPKITYSIVIILMAFLCNTLKSSILEWDSNLKFSFYFDIIVYPLKICFNSLRLKNPIFKMLVRVYQRARAHSPHSSKLFI